MRHLRFYTVHLPRRRAPLDMAPLFVREGFSWWAFVLTVLWTLYHRLWLASAAVAAAEISIYALAKSHFLGPVSIEVLMMAVHVTCGLWGNDWLRHKLSRGGYAIAGVVAAENLAHAQLRFIDRHGAAAV